jgi:hypothetical protein
MIWILLTLILSQAQGVESREGTAVVRGRITDAQTGAGMSHALVTIHLPRSGRRLETLANPDGYYEFRGLPAGPVSVRAAAGEHRATHVGGEFQTEVDGRRTSVMTLLEGQVRDGVDIALARALAIDGRVVDDAGAPLAGVWVRTFRAPGGQAAGGQVRRTDDRGTFRLFGLAAGSYFVCAELSTSHLFSGPVGGARRRDPVSACHRSTASDDMGVPITLTRADAAAVEIVAPRRPTLTVSGVVLDADGEPAFASVSATMIRKAGGGGSSRRASDGGRFTITDVPPGLYVLSATTISRGEPSPASDPQYVEVELALDVDDVEELVLLMRRPAQVKGRVVFDGGRPPENASGFAVRAEGRMRGEPGSRPRASDGPVDSAFRFELVNLFGPQVVTVSNLPRGWIVRAVRYRGADITGLPTEFRTGPDEVEIELTTRGAVLMGTVTDRSGNPGFPGRVVMFPADPARWHSGLAPSAVPIGRDGRFSLPARRAGDYLVVALAEEDYDGLGPAPSFDLLEKIAERVTLLDDDRRVVDLRLATLPGDDGR